jgi:hypothetical protein
MRRGVVAALLVVSAGLAGCGGDDDDDGGRPSREAYIAKADAICANANQRETASGVPAGGREVEDPRVQRIMVAGLRDTLGGLRELEAPEGDEARVAKVISSLQRVLTARDEQFKAARAGDGPAQTEAEEAFFTASQDLGVIAGPYGLGHCLALGF